MNAVSSQTAYNEIVAQIRKQGGRPSSWYAGTATNWEERLFGDHHVPGNHWYAARRCFSEADARSVAKDLLDYGCAGGPGGGDSPTYVYAYLKTAVTDP